MAGAGRQTHTDDGAHTSGQDNSAKDYGLASPSRPESRGDVGVYMHASNYTPRHVDHASQPEQ